MFELEPFRPFTSRAVPLRLADVDTDQISPGNVTLATSREALRDGLFRYRRDEDSGFVLNRPDMEGRTILVSGANFGCGSSRESAVWALCAWGFRAVVSTSFGEIFEQNALKNGLLPITLDEAGATELWRQLDEDPVLTIDLEAGRLATEDSSLALVFSIDPFARNLLLHGLDELAYLMQLDRPISAYEGSQAVHPSTQRRLATSVPPTRE